jgi:hypothetical protein
LDTAEAEERLRAYLLEGVGSQILWADLAYELAKEISEYREQINESNFGELFGTLLQILSDRQTLEATKLLDQEKNYPTRSIPGTLALLKRHATLWRIPQRERLIAALAQGDSKDTHLDPLSNEDLTYGVVQHYEANLPDAPLLLQSRDKVIAHSEHITGPALEAPTWGEATRVITFAKDFVITIGSGYLNQSWGKDSSDYIPQNSAPRPARGLARLLRKAGIVEETRPSPPSP